MGKAYPGYSNKLVHVEYKDGIKAIKVLTYITANEGFAKRTFNYVFYMIMAILIAPFLSKADVVISTSPQFFNGLAGYVVSRLKRAKWVLEIRDLWPESIVAVGAIKNQKIIDALEWVEKFAYRKADHIVPVTNAFRKHILARGGSDDRITVIRNGVDLNFFAEQPVDETFAESIGVKNKFVAAYVGTHGMAHGLDVILNAAEKLRERDDIVFLTAGDGAERSRLEQEVTRRGLHNVKMLGQLPKSQMPALWSVTGVSLVLLKKLDLFLTVIPSKIFETMAMKKPIILGVRGESQEIIESAGSGVCIEPENADELARAILKMADSPEYCKQLGEAGKMCVAAEFDRTVLAKRFEAVLINVASHSS
jgi:glycosyltransferase involved in cell wall biosynthesis